jgi:hypothetical protein
MKRSIAILLPLMMALLGCASNRGSDSEPSERQVQYVEARTVWSAYNQADAQCLNGYTTISELQQSVLDYVMAVQCR